MENIKGLSKGIIADSENSKFSDSSKTAVFADLHIHSRFSRATSKSIDIPNLEKYARIKGLGLLGTGDFQHALWFKELNELDEREGILYTKTNFPFIWQTEISLMYTQDGKGRRVHYVILAPNKEVVKQITSFLASKGRLDYDGRPIFGFNSVELVDNMLSISKDIEIIPAHCLLGDEVIHTNYSIKKIKEIKENDLVYTHNNGWKKVKEVLKKDYSGKMYKIRPWYFSEGLKTTPEHPFYAIRSYNCSWIQGLCKKDCSKLSECKNKRFESYNAEWIPASGLKKGDFLVYPRFNKTLDKRRIENIELTPELCKLVGYYLSEGYVIGDEAIGFSFNKSENEYISEVISLISKIFGKKEFKIDKRKGNDIIFYSRAINEFFSKFYNSNIKRANTKFLLEFMLELPLNKQVEIFRCWYRGDKGYTVSRELANQMKIICLRLGIIPNITLDTIEKFESRGKHFIKGRRISAKYTLYSFSHLSFFEDKFGLLNENEFKKHNTKMTRRHGWIDKNYIYSPIRKIEVENYNGEVYNLEVEDDNSYVSEFACIHNCWTPWFGIFGSKSGFDSLKEAFQDREKDIHAIETGMSSDPEMNWRLSQLNNKAIISFSDIHSFWPWRLGREATIFNLKEKLNYKDIIKQIRENSILGTVETEPAYGKYHYDGHRLCNFSSSPEETRKLKEICPVCKKPLTIGVENRVEELTDQEIKENKNKKPYYKLLPLHELIALAKASTLASKKTWGVYNELISSFKNEFNILLKAEKEDLARVLNEDEKLVELILKNREGKIKVKPGYDGEYGIPMLSEMQKKLL